MAIEVTEEMITRVSRLAKLSLNEKERQRAQRDMEQMLTYFDALDALDLENVPEDAALEYPIRRQAMSDQEQAGTRQNASYREACGRFREDAVTNGDMHAALLENAPKQQDDQYVVPKTI